MESSTEVFLLRQPAHERLPTTCPTMALGGKTAGLDPRYSAVGSGGCNWGRVAAPVGWLGVARAAVALRVAAGRRCASWRACARHGIKGSRSRVSGRGVAR